MRTPRRTSPVLTAALLATLFAPAPGFAQTPEVATAAEAPPGG